MRLFRLESRQLLPVPICVAWALFSDPRPFVEPRLKEIFGHRRLVLAERLGELI